MGDVINLNKWKKQKAREEKAKRAEQNRLRNGLSISERQLAEKKKQLANKQLDGHKLEVGTASEDDDG
jgi:hypothetical protein